MSDLKNDVLDADPVEISELSEPSSPISDIEIITNDVSSDETPVLPKETIEIDESESDQELIESHSPAFENISRFTASYAGLFSK